MEIEHPEWNLTEIFHKNLDAYLTGKRLILNEGGSSSSKTYSILQLLIKIAQIPGKKLLISVVSESLPHLRRGCIRDFQNILGAEFDNNRWNKSNFVYSFDNAEIEFFPADDPAKMRGSRRDILFINECNNVSYDAFQQLEMRTRITIFLDWNPVGEFFAHEKGFIHDPQNAYIHSTYKDAAWVLPQKIIESIEKLKTTDPNGWHIYGLGLLGRVEGLVYPYFEQIDQLPTRPIFDKDGKEIGRQYLGQEFYGLDFGYSNDPTALVRCILDADNLYCEELIYEAGLTNDAIAHRMDELGVKRNHAEIFADAAEPKSIDEICKFGFNVKPCPKGADSVEFGHQKIRQYKQFWTKASLNGIKEQRNFRYIADKNGKLTEKTTHTWSHILDARRYACIGVDNSYEFGFGST